jgi:hypothetical protein
MGMLVLTFVANVVAIQYAMGAVRSAVDRGARSGSAVDAPVGACQSEAVRTLRGPGGLLTGAVGESVRLSCHREGDTILARAEGRFGWWLGPFPEVVLTAEGRSVIEPPP